MTLYQKQGGAAIYPLTDLLGIVTERGKVIHPLMLPVRATFWKPDFTGVGSVETLHPALGCKLRAEIATGVGSSKIRFA